MKFRFLISVCVAAFFAASTPAAAQAPRAERPYRGLFGGGMGDVEQSLIWNGSTGGGYDDNVLAQDGLGGDPTTAQAGNFGSFSTSLSYSYSKPRVSVGMSGGMNGRYRPDSSDEFYAGYGGAIDLSFDMWQGARFTGNQSIGFQPYFTLDLAPSLEVPVLGEPVVGDPAFAGVIGEDYRYYNSELALSQRVSRRGSLAFSYYRQVGDFASASSDYTSSGGGASYSHTISRGLSLKAGYAFTESSSDSGAGVEPVRVHSIDAGVDFNRALSFSRRTTLSFSTGSSGVADAGGMRSQLTGAAQLRRELGRTWSAAAGYSRNVEFVDALRRPVLSDGATLLFGGLFNRRLEFNSSASLSFAHSSTGGGDEFDSYLAAAGLSYFMTRYVSLGLDYTFYRYIFAETAVVPPGFDPETKRQAIRASVSLWAPIFQRARRPDAAR